MADFDQENLGSDESDAFIPDLGQSADQQITSRQRLLAALPEQDRHVVIEATRKHLEDDDPMWGVMFALLSASTSTIRASSEQIAEEIHLAAEKIKTIENQSDKVIQAMNAASVQTRRDAHAMLESFGKQARDTFKEDRTSIRALIDKTFDASIKSVATARSGQLFRVFSRPIMLMLAGAVGLGFIVGMVLMAALSALH